MDRERTIQGLEVYQRMLLEELDEVKEQIWDLRLGKIEPEDVDLDHCT